MLRIPLEKKNSGKGQITKTITGLNKLLFNFYPTGLVKFKPRTTP